MSKPCDASITIRRSCGAKLNVLVKSIGIKPTNMYYINSFYIPPVNHASFVVFSKDRNMCVKRKFHIRNKPIFQNVFVCF